MFSGLVTVTTLRSLGSSSVIDCVTTGIVIRKMINNTSITSTRGVVLMLEVTSSSSPLSPGPTFIDMRVPSRYRRSMKNASSALAGQQHVVQIARESANLFHHRLVAANQPVVAHDGRNGDGQTDGGHDQRFTDGACDLVDGGLAGNADLGQGAVDAPHRAEQADERSGGADGGQERQAIGQAAGDVFDGARNAHRDPGVAVRSEEHTS